MGNISIRIDSQNNRIQNVDPFVLKIVLVSIFSISALVFKYLKDSKNKELLKNKNIKIVSIKDYFRKYSTNITNDLLISGVIKDHIKLPNLDIFFELRDMNNYSNDNNKLLALTYGTYMNVRKVNLEKLNKFYLCLYYLDKFLDERREIRKFLSIGDQILIKPNQIIIDKKNSLYSDFTIQGNKNVLVEMLKKQYKFYSNLESFFYSFTIIFLILDNIKFISKYLIKIMENKIRIKSSIQILRNCIICKYNDTNILMNCNHFNLCLDCLKKLNKICPICNIKSNYKIILNKK